MSTPAWSKRRIVAVITVGLLVALAAVQTYQFIGGQSRTSGTTGSTNNTSGGTTGSDAHTITVTGTGVASLAPDRAILTIGVVTNSSSAETAVQQNANIMHSVITALEAIGIDNSSIQTTYYYIYPQTCCYPYIIRGYQVTNEIQVTLLGAGQTLGWLGTETGMVIDTATSHGATEINGITFTASTTALQQARQQALKDAALNASQDAHTLAAALNVTITGVVSVNPTSTYQLPIYYGGLQSVSVTTPVIAPSSLSVTASVQVVFSIS
jgi:uncharacterized protein